MSTENAPAMTLEAVRYVAARLSEEHDRECDSYDGCGCFDRLHALVMGEPDPLGLDFVAGPEFGCAEPHRPMFGPPTLEEWAMERALKRIEANIYAPQGSAWLLAGLSSVTLGEP